MSQQMISLDEIAQVTGRKAAEVGQDARRLNIWVGTDWAGREAIGERDARALVSGAARARAEQRADWAAFQDEVTAYQEGRTAACKAAADEAENKLRRGPRIGLGVGSTSPGEINAARREASLHAGAQYERRYARPRFNGEPGLPLCFLADETEEGSRKAAVIGKLRGPKAAARTEVA